MNILLLNGSPKAHSTTLDMTKAFLNGLCQTEPAHIQYISSYDKNVKYCQGDLSCWFRQDGQCIIQDDDMNDILAAMKKSDVIVWSFPLHCHGLPASLKAIWDRTIAFLKINMTQGETYVEHERTFDLTAKKHVVIVGGGYPYYPENFAAVKTLMQIYLKHPAMACICETALLDASAPEIEPLKKALFARLHEAGIEYGKTGQLSAETVRQLEAPLVSNEKYIAMINSLAPDSKAQ